ncbi:MAG: hypothetical protein WHT64_04510, partial [Desulfomicrobiaceae bacterium]
MALWRRFRLPPLAQLALLGVTFAAAAFLSLEVWMQAVRHTSLCTTTGCAVVGEYIRFGEGNLLKLGAAFFWLLWLVAFFAGRYPKAWIWGGFGLLVAGALAFDGTLLGFQFVALREFCLICAITGGLPAQRNHLDLRDILEAVYETEGGLARGAHIPNDPELPLPLDKV